MSELDDEINSVRKRIALGLGGRNERIVADYDDLRTRLAAAEQRAAASQAENVALREALKGVHEAYELAAALDRFFDHYRPIYDRIRSAAATFETLATPHDASALRALMMTAANMGYQDGEARSSRSPADVVDEILRGGR